LFDPITASTVSSEMAMCNVVGVASQASYFVGSVPIFAALGIPFELLAVFIAVETIPDIFRTLGNVSMDLAVTSLLDRWTPSPEQAATGNSETS
jgi:Na+/H+-dicarboxylate symporter